MSWGTSIAVASESFQATYLGIKVYEAGGNPGDVAVAVDFTRVECRLTEVAVEAYGETSGVTIIIPDGWAADTSGMDPGAGGLTDTTTPDRLPGTPLIRLTGSGGMAGVVIRHPDRRERRKLHSNPTQG